MIPHPQPTVVVHVDLILFLCSPTVCHQSRPSRPRQLSQDSHVEAPASRKRHQAAAASSASPMHLRSWSLPQLVLAAPLSVSLHSTLAHPHRTWFLFLIVWLQHLFTSSRLHRSKLASASFPCRRLSASLFLLHGSCRRLVSLSPIVPPCTLY